MLVCGKNVLKETPKNKIHKVYLKENFKDKEILSYLKENKLKYEFVPEFRLNKMVREQHQGVVIDIDEYDYFSIHWNTDYFITIFSNNFAYPFSFGSYY